MGEFIGISREKFKNKISDYLENDPMVINYDNTIYRLIPRIEQLDSKSEIGNGETLDENSRIY